jgi:hypothetical protein
VLHAVRAVDTATHPDYQGKGLFNAMTMHGLDVIADDGIDFVFNTPNDKSRPGYLKMGWQEVGRLPVAIKLASPAAALTVARSRVAASHWPIDIGIGEPIEQAIDRTEIGPAKPADNRSLVTNRSHEFFAWRYGLPMLGYRSVPDTHGVVVVRLRQRGAARELVVLDAFCDGPPSVSRSTLGVVGATHALRVGLADVGAGFLLLPGGGPVLAFRGIAGRSMAPMPNWLLGMGDIELF